MFFGNKIYINQENLSMVNPSAAFITNVVTLELINYGTYITPPTQAAMCRMPTQEAELLAEHLLNTITVGKLNPPLFKNWEFYRRSNDNRDLGRIILQMFSNTVGISGNDLYDPDFMNQLESSITNVNWVTEITLATREEALDKFKSLARVRSHKDQYFNIAQGFKYFQTNDWIPNTQARVQQMIERGTIVALKSMKLAPHDVLRVFAELYEADSWVLPHDVKYTNLTAQERIAALTFLSNMNIEKLMEAFGINRNAWAKFFAHVKLFQQKQFRNKFKRLIAYYHVSRGSDSSAIPVNSADVVKEMLITGVAVTTPTGNLAYRTFASRVDTAIKAKDFKSIQVLMTQRPSYLLQNIATVSNAVDRKNEAAFLKLCRDSLPHANMNTLVSILEINVGAKFRIIDVKGKTTVAPANYSPVIAAIQKDIEAEMFSRYGVSGQIVVAPEVKNSVVPCFAKNQVLTRGSRIKFDDKNFMHFFMHWIQKGRSVDLDHSWIMVDKNDKMSSVSFMNDSNSFISQSGDILSAPAPHGATESSVIDLNNIPKNMKFIMPVINVYSYGTFKEDCSTAYAGFMFNDGRKFNINREHTRYDLTQPSTCNVPFVIDMVNREVVIIDFNTNERSGSIARSYAQTLLQIYEVSTTLNKMTAGRMAEMLSGNDKGVEYTIDSVSGSHPNAYSLTDCSKFFE